MSEIGHNSSAVDRLRSIIARIERLAEDRVEIQGDIKHIYTEAKSAGYDTKILRRLIRIRAQDQAKYEEEEILLDTYRTALAAPVVAASGAQ